MASTLTYRVQVNRHEDRNVLVIKINGKIAMEFTDRGEPQDNSFDSDYYWIPQALESAYKLGREHAVLEGALNR